MTGESPKPAPGKGPAAFRTISEASAEVGVPQHVLRFWETRFTFISPTKRAGGRRFYRPQDLEVLRGVRRLLQEDGYTVKGVQKLHKEQGLRRLLAAAGVGEETARDLEVEAAAMSMDDEAAEIGRSREAASSPPSLEGDDRDDLTGDLFGDAEDPPRPRAEPPGTPAAPAVSERSSHPVLDTAARGRLVEVLTDLETTKAAIDALLVEG